MPNIFEGFEESNPEETANKLGITKESIGKGTKKEILESIDGVEGSWICEYDINKVKPGMKGKWENNGGFYIVQEVDTKNKTISIKLEDMSVYADVEIGKEKLWFMEEQLDFDTQEKRTRFSDLVTPDEFIPEFLTPEGLYIHYCMGEGFEKAIQFLVEVKDNTYTVLEGKEEHEWQRASFTNNFAIHNNFLDQVKPQLEKRNEKYISLIRLKYKDLKNYNLWEYSTEVNLIDIKPGMRVNSYHEQFGLLGGIIESVRSAGVGGINIRRILPDDNTFITSNSSKFYIYSNDIKPTIEDEEILNDDNKWKKIGDFSALEEGMRVRYKIGTRKWQGGKIIEEASDGLIPFVTVESSDPEENNLCFTKNKGEGQFEIYADDITSD